MEMDFKIGKSHVNGLNVTEWELDGEIRKTQINMLGIVENTISTNNKLKYVQLFKVVSHLEITKYGGHLSTNPKLERY